MTTSRRKLGLIIITLGVLILALFIYLLIASQNKQADPVIDEEGQGAPVTGQLPEGDISVNEPNITSGDKPRNFQEYDISKEVDQGTTTYDLVKISQAFTERFGSYSNYSNYSNFSDLKIFMTSKMKTWAENYVEELRNSSQGSDEYFGVTTEAISSQVLEESNNQMVVLVTTLRREGSSRVNQGNSYNQDIKITLQNISGDWLVDSAYWQ